MQHINTFSKGMVGGIDYSIVPQTSYVYMMNGCIVSRDDKGYVITGIKGTEDKFTLAANEVPIGSVVFNSVLYVITHKIVESVGSICFYSYPGSNGTTWQTNELLTLIPNGTGLKILESVIGYSREKLLQVFAKGSYDGSVDIYICDGLNPNIVVNTGLDKNGKKTQRQYVSYNDASVFLLQKTLKELPIASGSIQRVGSMKPGTYYVYLRYEDESLNVTPFITELGPYYIHPGSKDKNTALGVANENEARISKKIVIDVATADANYKSLSVAVVYYYGENGVLSRDNYLVDKSYPLINGTAKIVIDGTEAQQVLTVEEILSDNLPYNTSESHLQIENRYYGANWKANNYDMKKLSDFAKLVVPHAVVKGVDNFNNVHDETNIENEYKEEEMYPFGIAFLIDGSFKTPVFPIMGWSEGHAVSYLYRGAYDIAAKYAINDAVTRNGFLQYNVTGENNNLNTDWQQFGDNASLVTRNELRKYIEEAPLAYNISVVYEVILKFDGDISAYENLLGISYRIYKSINTFANYSEYAYWLLDVTNFYVSTDTFVIHLTTTTDNILGEDTLYYRLKNIIVKTGLFVNAVPMSDAVVVIPPGESSMVLSEILSETGINQVVNIGNSDNRQIHEVRINGLYIMNVQENSHVVADTWKVSAKMIFLVDEGVTNFAGIGQIRFSELIAINNDHPDYHVLTVLYADITNVIMTYGYNNTFILEFDFLMDNGAPYQYPSHHPLDIRFYGSVSPTAALLVSLDGTFTDTIEVYGEVPVDQQMFTYVNPDIPGSTMPYNIEFNEFDATNNPPDTVTIKDVVINASYNKTLTP